MTDIKDLIASSSINAFNDGVKHGRQLERERVTLLLTELLTEFQVTDTLERYVLTLTQRIETK
jgi:hypothetical protein